MKKSRKEYHRLWALANPDKVKAKRDRYYARHSAEHKEELNRKRRERYASDLEYREKLKTLAREYAVANSDKNKQRYYAWKEKNPARCRAIVAACTAKRRTRVVSWLSKKQKEIIAALYDTAQQMSEATGIRYEVDHIIPLQGKRVSGLHVPLNLRIVPMTYNRRKAARYEP